MKSIDHLNRYVSDIEKFIYFYKNVLDYKLIDKGLKVNGKQYAILMGKDHELFISEKDNFEPEAWNNFRHIGYSVENVEELLETLKTKGFIEVNSRIIEKAYSKQFYVKDPDGFEIDLIEWTDKQKFYHSFNNTETR